MKNNDTSKEIADSLKIKSERLAKDKARQYTSNIIQNSKEQIKEKVYSRRNNLIKEIDSEVRHTKLNVDLTAEKDKLNKLNHKKEPLLNKRQSNLYENHINLELSNLKLNETVNKSFSRNRIREQSNVNSNGKFTLNKDTQFKLIRPSEHTTVSSNKQKRNNYRFSNEKNKTKLNKPKKLTLKNKSDIKRVSQVGKKQKISVTKKEINLEKNIQRKAHKSVKRKPKINSPLTSKKIGKRNIVQKTITSPGKIISIGGASLKEGLNEEIAESDVAGVQLANDIVSPLARKLRFESKKIISKNVGFDRKAHKLNKIDKKLNKIDKKELKIKKAQRKKIRKTAKLKDKATAGSNVSIFSNTRELLSSSFSQLKEKIRVLLKRAITSIKNLNLLAGSGMLIVNILISIIMISPIILGGVALTTIFNNQKDDIIFSISSLSEDVMRWEEAVLNELKKYGLEKYKDLALVIIHLESRGNLPDVMQSSESIGLPPNTITDPLESIEVGIKHLKKVLESKEEHGVDIQTAIHAYNYGVGFVPYVANNGGKWTQTLANKFSEHYAEQYGWNSYGDPLYVSKAMEHLSIENGDVILAGGSFDLAGGKLEYPVPGHEAVSSSYGWRIHPITGDRKFHTGTDIPAPSGTPVIAAADGTVIESGWKGGYGNAVVIDHGSGVQTLYAHNSELIARAGQKVKVGQLISKVGTTGSSTGNHLHFEVRKNGEHTDPLKWKYN